MNTLKKIAGKCLYAITKLISGIFTGLIAIIETIVTFVGNIAKGFAALIGMGGCLLIFMLAGPFGLALLLNPAVLLIILFFVIFPILGTQFVSYLKYLKYIITEYLYDRSNYLIHGTIYQFETFGDYKSRYKDMEYEKKRKEQQRRQSEQQNEWEDMFKRWSEYQNYQRGNSGQTNYGGYNQGSYYGNKDPYVNPATEFNDKYRKSCDMLGVGYNADKYEIKLAYRKKAKQYHPDLNKSPDATRMFQEINDAYEFLNDDNINRYKNIN